MLDKIKNIFRQRRARGITVARGRVLARRLAISSVVIGLFVYWLHPPIFERIDIQIRDLTFQIRRAPSPPSDVVLVTIDEKSIKRFGRWPWPRALQAKLISRLKAMGAGTIALDIVYPMLQANAEDRALIASLKSPGAPVIGGYFFRDEQSVKLTDQAVDNVRRDRIAMILETSDSRTDTIIEFPYVEPNHPYISPYFYKLGFFNSIPDTDGLIRSAPLILKYEDNFYPSLPLQALSAGIEEDIFVEFDSEGVRVIRLGKIEIPVNAQGELALNFYNGNFSMQQYSASDIIEGIIPFDAIKGKLIFIGVTELGIADLRPTPVNHSFPGVGIHATVAANILQGFYLYNDNRTILMDMILILLLPLVMAWIMSRVLQPLLITGVFLLSGGLLWTIFFLAITKFGFLISLFYPMVSLTEGYFIFLSYEIFITDAKTRYMRRALSSYVSPRVASRLISDPDSLILSGERREITVLFSDIRGFTTLSEGMSPEELVMLLNDYLGPMTEIVMQQNGTLDKYIGDAVMALYNAPLDLPDHAMRAARSAIEMQEKLQELNVTFEKNFGLQLKIGIGIHTGDAIVGNMGSRRRFNYTAMGDMVNLASRLESLTKYYKVSTIISKSTNDRLSDDCIRRHLDRIQVKGKKLPVDIFQLFVDGTDDSTQTLIDRFENALELYLVGNFEKGLEEFEKLNSFFPDDHPVQIYIERCRQNINNPPSGKWDGVFIMTDK